MGWWRLAPKTLGPEATKATQTKTPNPQVTEKKKQQKPDLRPRPLGADVTWAQIVSAIDRHKGYLARLLRNSARPVSVAKGRIRLYIKGTGLKTPDDIKQEFTICLKQATGDHWHIELAGPMEVGGVPTLAEELKKQAEDRRATFKRHPVVKSVMDYFPGAKVTDVQ